MKKYPVLFAALLLLTGCVTTSDVQNFQLGPKPENAQAEAQNFILGALKDPDSAHFQMGPMMRGAVEDGLIFGGKVHHGWVQVVNVNAKNSYGGYTGFQRYYIMFEDGMMKDITPAVNDGQMAQVVSEQDPKSSSAPSVSETDYTCVDGLQRKGVSHANAMKRCTFD